MDMNTCVRVGCRWKGERRFFEGVIENYDPSSHAYTVVYDDGDRDDGLEFRKYKVEYAVDGNKIETVRVNEHNLDDIDETSSQQKGSLPFEILTGDHPLSLQGLRFRLRARITEVNGVTLRVKGPVRLIQRPALNSRILHRESQRNVRVRAR